MVAASATLVGGAAAAVTDSDRTIESTELAPGESTQVTVTVTDDEGTGPFVLENFDPAFANVEVVEANPFPQQSGSNEDNTQLTAAWGSEDSETTFSITYEVTVPEDAADGDEFTISSDDTSDVDLGTDTITVAEDGSGEPDVTASVSINDQTAVGSADAIDVASASASVDYVIAIHEEGDGGPGDIVGVSQVFNADQEASDVTVDLDQSLTESQEVFAMIHEADESAEDNLGPALSDVEGFLDSAQLTVLQETDLPELTSPAVHYESGLSGDVVLELGFADDVSAGALDSLEVLDEDGNVLATEEDVDLSIDGDRVVATVGAFVPADEVQVTDGDGNTQSASVSVARTTATLADGETTDVVSGGLVAIEVPADQRGALLTFSGDGFDSFDRGLGAGSQATVVDTSSSRLSGTGGFNVSTDAGFEAEVNFQPLGLAIDAASTEVVVGNDIEAQVDADRVDRDVTVELRDSDGEVVESFDDTTSGIDGTLDVAFSEDVYDGTGDFTVAVTDIATGVTVETDTISVVTAPDASASLGEATVEQNVGDIAEIPVELSATDSANVVLTIDGYTANVDVTDGDDDGQVTLQVNTRFAGDGADRFDAFSAAAEDDSVSVNSVDDIGQQLPRDAYSVRVNLNDERQDRGQLILTERSTDQISAHIAPASTAGPTVDAEEFLNNQVISNSVAQGDTFAFLIQASGLSGAFDGFAGEDGVTFQLVEQDPGAFEEAETFTSESDAISVVPAGEDQYLVEVDTSADGLTSIGSFDAEFVIDGEENPYVAEDATEELSSELSIEPADIEFLDANEDGVYSLVNEAGTTVQGNTNLAPGTGITVNIAGDAFFDSETVEVADDGSFSAEFDLSGVDPDQDVSIDVETDTGLTAETPAEFGDAPESDLVTNVEELQQQIADLEDQLADRNATIDELNNEIDNLTEELANAEDEQAALEEELSTVEDERAELQNELANAEATIGDLESQVSDLEGQVSDLESTNSDLESQVSELEGANEDLQTVFDELGVDNVDDAVSEIQNLSESGDSDDSGPGFGIAAALVALVAAALLAVRRRD